jgi:hypothetical protein
MHEQSNPQVRAKDGFASAVFYGCTDIVLRAIVHQRFDGTEEIRCVKCLEGGDECTALPKARTLHFSD